MKKQIKDEMKDSRLKELNIEIRLIKIHNPQDCSVSLHLIVFRMLAFSASSMSPIT